MADQGHGPIALRTVSVPARRVVKDAACPFALAVPEAGLDVLFLFDQPPDLPMVELFQHVLRNICATGRKVDRAALTQGQICLEVDGIALGFGPDRLPERRSGSYCRPAGGTRGPDKAARLGLVLQRHQASLRLRVGRGAEDALLSELVEHVCMGRAPKAVVLLGRRLVLSLAEFRQHKPSRLDLLSSGPTLPRPVARYARPPAPEGSTRRRMAEARKPLLPQGRQAGYDAAMLEHRSLQSALRGSQPGKPPARTPPRVAALAVAALSGVVLIWG
ncbi:hypothetical protein J1C52_10930 [Roseibaca sp. Y0-43]|nr:hypothetical protein [Roseibaca sp. Y0-43]